MHEIKLFNEDLNLFKNGSFLLIKPTSYIYNVGDRYFFKSSARNDDYLGRRLLKFKHDFLLKDISENYTWLSKNCDKKTFLEIHQTVFKSKLTDSFSVLIFSDVETKEYIEHQQQLQLQKNRMI